MAADEPGEEFFEGGPEGIKTGQLKQAWKAREFIWRLTTEGATPGQIAPSVRAPKAAVEWVIAHRPTEGPEAAPPQEPPKPAAPPTAAPPGSAPAAPAAAPPPPTDSLPPRGSGAAPVPQPSPAGPAFTPLAQAAPLQPATLSAPNLTDVEGATKGSLLSGAFQSPDVYGLLNSILLAYGCKREEALGIIFTFSLEADPNDLDTLRRLLVTAGKNEWIVKSVLHSWDVVLKRQGSAVDTVAPKGDVQARLRAFDRSLGIGGGDSGRPPSPEEMSLDDLEKRRLALEIREREAMLADRERKLRDTTGTPSTADAEKVDLMVSIGGGLPQKITVPASVAQYYERFLVKPGPAEPPRAAEEPPPWAKAIIEEQQRLREREAEERRRRDDDERLARILDQRLGPIEQRLQGGGPDSETAKRLADLEKQLGDRRDEDLRRWQERMEQLVRDGASPERAQQIMEAEDARARSRGYIPRREAGQLSEEQIDLEEQRATSQVRTRAQGELTGALTERVREKPVQSLLQRTGLERTIGRVGDRLAGTIGGEGSGGGAAGGSGDLREPAPEEMEAALRALEGQTGGPPPPAEARRRGPAASAHEAGVG